MQKKHHIITSILLWIFSTLLIYVSWLGALIRFGFSLLLYGCITYLFYRTWKWIRWSSPLNISAYFKIFLYRVFLSLFICVLILGWFTVYQNHISPAKVPLYTLTNGEKTIQFQTMSHIASPDFYEWVKNNITTAKKEGFVLYYEWVRPWSKESSEIFNTALGINFSEGLYENFSKLYGIVAQDNADFLSIENEEDYNIDLSLDEVVRIYQEKISQIPEKSEWILASEEVLDINSEALSLLSELSPRQLLIVRYINQSLMNFMLKHESLRDSIVENFWNTDIFSVILDDRNSYLVEEILTSSHENIFVIYGLMHFSWVYELLQQEEWNWEIVSTEYMQIIVQDGQRDNW